jgi:hypothetical protein
VETIVVDVYCECSIVVMGRAESGRDTIGRNWTSRKGVVVLVGIGRSRGSRAMGKKNGAKASKKRVKGKKRRKTEVEVRRR